MCPPARGPRIHSLRIDAASSVPNRSSPIDAACAAGASNIAVVVIISLALPSLHAGISTSSTSAAWLRNRQGPSLRASRFCSKSVHEHRDRPRPPAGQHPPDTLQHRQILVREDMLSLVVLPLIHRELLEPCEHDHVVERAVEDDHPESRVVLAHAFDRPGDQARFARALHAPHHHRGDVPRLVVGVGKRPVAQRADEPLQRPAPADEPALQHLHVAACEEAVCLSGEMCLLLFGLATTCRSTCCDGAGARGPCDRVRVMIGVRTAVAGLLALLACDAGPGRAPESDGAVPEAPGMHRESWYGWSLLLPDGCSEFTEERFEGRPIGRARWVCPDTLILLPLPQRLDVLHVTSCERRA